MGSGAIMLALLGMCCTGEGIQIKLHPEKTISYVALSSNATLTCEASGLGGKAVTWGHLEKQIANVAADTVIFSDPTNQNKYEIGKGGADGGNFTFTILSFTIQDSGHVSCGVIGVDPQSTQLEAFVWPESISLSVESRHRQTTWNGTENAKVLDLQDESTFSCSVLNSRPKATIYWMWNGIEIVSNISNVIESTMDLYNVTSYVTVPSRTFDFSKVKEMLSEGTSNMTSVVEKVIDGETGDKAIVTKVETTLQNPTGEISCKASVGSQSYVASETILLTDYDTAGIPRLSSYWSLTASVALLSYVLLSTTVL